LRTISENLRINLKQVKNEIIQQSKENLDELQPQIDESENYLLQMDRLGEKINDFKHDLEDQVTV